MKIKLALISALMLLSSCMVVPTIDHSYFNRCEISSDRKTLKVIDVAKGSNSYYSISGLIVYPISGIVSGIYVAVNNVYHYGEEKIVCRSEKT